MTTPWQTSVRRWAVISCSSLCLTEVSPPQGQFSASSTEKLMGRSAEDSEVFYVVHFILVCSTLCAACNGSLPESNWCTLTDSLGECLVTFSYWWHYCGCLCQHIAIHAVNTSITHCIILSLQLLITAKTLYSVIVVDASEMAKMATWSITTLFRVKCDHCL